MKTQWIRPVTLALLALTTAAAWALLISVAMQISTIVLQTLDMIVELAAISP